MISKLKYEVPLGLSMLTECVRDYDMHGPAGPTAFWKLTDELAEEKTNSMPIAFF